MKAVVQRVKRARVQVDDETVGQIGVGLLVLLGVEKGDDLTDLSYLATKITGLRIFEDEQGKMNLSVLDVGGELLVVSQFTLLADCRKGRRPGFSLAADPLEARRLYELFVERVRACGCQVATGRFQEDMDVELVNQGPVTMLLDSRRVY